MEEKEKKLSLEFECLLQKIRCLEEDKQELNIIRAILEVNFGENGRITKLWKGDLTTMSMLTKTLKHLSSRGSDGAKEE